MSKKSYYDPYYKPIGNKVMVNPAVDDMKDQGGILIPEEALPPIQRAVVIKTGRGVGDAKPIVKAGDTIIMPRGIGSEVAFGDANYRIIKELDVLAIV